MARPRRSCAAPAGAPISARSKTFPLMTASSTSRRAKTTAAFHPGAVFVHDLVPTKVLAESLVRPRVSTSPNHGYRRRWTSSGGHAICFIDRRARTLAISHCVLPARKFHSRAATRLARSSPGPGFFSGFKARPDPGKTYIGARMDLRAGRERGRTVGITAQQPQGHSQSAR